MKYSGFIVLALVKNKNKQILMVKLKKVGSWGLPGGKVKIGELPRETLAREIKEEIGVSVQIDRLVGFREYFWEPDSHFWVDLIYKAKIISGTPRIKEPGKILEIDWRNINDLPVGTHLV